jgi:hypothetical protein
VDPHTERVDLLGDQVPVDLGHATDDSCRSRLAPGAQRVRDIFAFDAQPSAAGGVVRPRQIGDLKATGTHVMSQPHVRP